MPEEAPTAGRPHSWKAARHYCYQVAAPLRLQTLQLSGTVGRVTARDVESLCPVPHYDSSAMDGWAVSGAAPWALVDTPRLEHGQATTVLTGGLIPSGCEAVLRSERGTVRDSDTGQLLDRNGARPDEPRPGEHIREAGTEARTGDTVIAAGTVLNPAHIAVAAVCGHDQLEVVGIPQVELLLTGDEVIESGVPEPGYVRDSFGPQLPSVIAMLGASVFSARHLADDLAVFTAAINDSRADVIITTGGTGGSCADHLHTALHDLGAHILIDGVSMRPGSPSLLARLSDGRFLVGLPGNPLAAMVGVLTLVEPLLAALSGDHEPELGSVTVHGDLTGRPATSRLLPYRLEGGVAVQSRWQGSGMMRGLAEAAGFLVCPPEGVAAGSDAQTLGLPWTTPRGFNRATP